VFHAASIEGQPIYVASSPCALPCFYGITPGETPYTRAVTYIAGLPQEQNVDDRSFWITGNSQNKIYVEVRKFDPREPDFVDTIELETYDATPILSLGQFIDMGWTPRHVYRVRASRGIVLLLVFGDSGQIMAVVADNYAINADSPIDWLWLAPAKDSEYYLGYVRGRGLFDTEVPWLGYASADNYWAAKSIGEPQFTSIVG
jgi:hypothetical protein